MPNKIKIYINGRFLTQPITGVQRYAHELIMVWDHLIEQNQIDTNKYKFILLSPARQVIHQLNLQNIKIEKAGLFTGHLWEQLELPLYSRDGILFCPGNTAPFRSLYTDQQILVTVHDLSYLYFPDAYSLLFKLWYHILIPAILKKADRVITVSHSEKSSIIKHYPHVENKLVAIQNGGLPQKFLNVKSGKQKQAKNRFILYVGAISKRKNFQGVLRAFELVREKLDVGLTVAGASGKAFSSSDLVNSFQISDRVIFKGQIDNLEELIDLFKSASCLLFPSFYEASPLPPIEAMACGCPVIASSIPSLIERCGDAALYCDPNNPHDIAEKILQVLNNPQLRENLINKGLERAKKYNWNTCGLETFQVIRQLLADT